MDPVREVRAVRLVGRARFARAEEGRDVLGQGDLEEKVCLFFLLLRLREEAAESEQLSFSWVQVRRAGRPRSKDLPTEGRRERSASAGVEGRLPLEVKAPPEV